MILVRAALIFAFAFVAVHAQAPTARPTFEVASVKPNRSGEPRVMIRSEPGGRFTATNVPLRALIRNAYGITEDSRIVDAPGWVGSERFDIVAKASSDVPPLIPGGAVGPMNLMLQALLEDRFRLGVHRETRELPLYVLSIAAADRRLGPRLTRTTVDCVAILAKLYPPNGPAPSASAICSWPASAVRIDRRPWSGPGARHDDRPACIQSVGPCEPGGRRQDGADWTLRHQP